MNTFTTSSKPQHGIFGSSHSALRTNPILYPYSHHRRTLTLFMLLFLVFGQILAWNECYYVDQNVGWSSTNYGLGTATYNGQGSIVIYMPTNHYFKFRINGNPVGESTNKELNCDGTGVRLYRWDNGDPYAAKYIGKDRRGPLRRTD